MNTTLFLISLALAVLGPLIAVTYLRPILTRVLGSLCDADGGAVLENAVKYQRIAQTFGIPRDSH